MVHGIFAVLKKEHRPLITLDDLHVEQAFDRANFVRWFSECLDNSLMTTFHPDRVLGRVEPEVAFAYSGAEFNEGFSPVQLADLGRQRAEARWQRKTLNRVRYLRRYQDVSR